MFSGPGRCKKTKAAKLHFTQSLVRDRLQVGKAYLPWFAAFAEVGTPVVPAKPRNPHVVFLQSTYPHMYNASNPVQKKDKSWLIRSVKLAATLDEGGNGLSVIAHGGALGRKRKISHRTPDERLKCLRGTRGRKHHCPALRKAL